MKKTIILILFFSIMLISCHTYDLIRYKVSARKDPFLKTNIAPSTFAFYSDTTNSDVLVEKNILFLISTHLSSKGWEMKSIAEAEYIISVKFNIEDKHKNWTHEGSGYYDKKNQRWVSGQQTPMTDYYYERTVKITVFRRGTAKEYIWSADCVSDGSTQDILYAAKYMIPYAMSKFPEEGIWNNAEKINLLPNK